MDEIRPDIPNLLNREFNQSKLNTHWCSDITYIRTAKGWRYLATIIDLVNKEVVGYATSECADTALVIKALASAILKHKPNLKALMFYSDQGTQYTSRELRLYLKKEGLTKT